MLQAYIDDSMTDGDVLVLAGLISPVERWEEFSVKWQERLDHAGWPVFKMAKISWRGSDQAMEHAKWHYFTIRDYAEGAICITVPLLELRLVAAKHRLGGTAVANPYIWAFKGIIGGLAKHQREWGIDEPVDFIFDERPEEQQIRSVWDYYLSTLPDDIRKLTGRRPIFEDDERVLPLQAADMWAWWCRKTWRENGGILRPNSYPIPWGKVEDIPQLIFQWSPAQLAAEVARVASGVDDLSQERPS